MGLDVSHLRPFANSSDRFANNVASDIKPDETAVSTIERCLAESVYDCVVIGAGVRLPPSRLGVFEAVVNAVHRAAPRAAIAFNTRPEDSGAAAARWI